MVSVNKVILLGYVHKEPELRYLASGKAMLKFSMATHDNWKNDNGEWQNKTHWHQITCFGQVAELANERIFAGSHVYVEGKLNTREWVDKDGKTRYFTDIIAYIIKPISKRQKKIEYNNIDDIIGSDLPEEKNADATKELDDILAKAIPTPQKKESEENEQDDDLPF